MNDCDLPKFRDLLNQYICERFKYKMPDVYTSPDGDKVYCETRRVELFLRWKSDRETLVVARIFFKETRRGHGTDFLKLLVNNSNVFGFKQIEIECANLNSAAFAEKMGFHNYEKKNWRALVENINV